MYLKDNYYFYTSIYKGVQALYLQQLKLSAVIWLKYNLKWCKTPKQTDKNNLQQSGTESITKQSFLKFISFE